MKKYFRIIILFFLFTTSVYARGSGTGIVVGNGAGVVEGNFIHALQLLNRIVTDYVKVNVITEKEKNLLKSIKKIATDNSSVSDLFAFLSERKNPGFFKTSETENHRIAFTYPYPGATIFVNSDLLYNDGLPALSFKTITALIIHELGHQAGEENHQFLDFLGSKVSSYLETQSFHYKYSRDMNSVSISVLNFEAGLKRLPVIYFGHQSTASLNLSDSVWKSYRCSDESWTTGKITNGHFEFTKNRDVVFKAWIETDCRDLKPQPDVLTIELGKDLSFTGLFIN